MTVGADDRHGEPIRYGRLAAAAAIAVAVHLLAALLPFAPGVDPLPGRMALAITALTTSCWLLDAMPLAAASLLPVVLLPLCGVQSTAAVCGSYSHPILWLFGGGFVLALAVERWGLHRRIAMLVIRKLGASPRRLVMGFFLAATLVSMWINNTSVALMLLPIGTVLVQRTLALGTLDQRHARNFSAGIMVAIAYGASIGGIGTPIGTAPNALFFKNCEPLVAQGMQPVSFLAWMLGMAPIALVLAVLSSFVITRWILPLPAGALPRGDELLREAAAVPPMTVPERRTAVLFAVAALLWMTRADVELGGFSLPGWASLLLPARSASYLADGTVAVLVALASFLVPAGGGHRGPLMDWHRARHLPFDLLFLLGAGIAMAESFGPVGLNDAFGALLKPLLESSSPFVLLLAVMAAMTLLSEIASNTAVATLMLPILREGAIAAGMQPLALMLPATLGASCGFMLPIATPPNTVVFGSRLITVRQMAKAGIAIDVLGVLVIAVMLWWFVLPMLGIGFR